MLSIRDGGSEVPLWTRPSEDEPQGFSVEMLRGNTSDFKIVSNDPIYRGFGGSVGMVYFGKTPVGSVTKVVTTATESVFAFHIGYCLQTVKFFTFCKDGQDTEEASANYQILDQARVAYPA